MDWWIDFLLGVVLLAVIPFTLAAYGGHVAADSITDDRRNRWNVKLRFWGLGFIGLLIAIAYQYRTMKTDETRQDQTRQFQKSVTERLNQIINQPISKEQKQEAIDLKQQVKNANPARPRLPQTTIIQTNPSYGDLAKRCSGVADAILSYVQARNKERPNPSDREAFKEWFMRSDGMFQDILDLNHFPEIYKDLWDRNYRDYRLDDLLKENKRHMDYRAGGGDANEIIAHPMFYHLNLVQIEEIGDRLKNLCTEVPTH